MRDRRRGITWSGIALHGGVLPGYPASHGCVRMPFDFAEHLFELTRMGMRVIVAPGDAAPIDVAHPALFPSKPGAARVARSMGRNFKRPRISKAIAIEDGSSSI